jgi:hypothetical protein
MKRLLVIISAILCMSAVAAAQSTPSLYGVISGTGVTNHDFSAWQGGLQLGTAVPLDSDKGLILRTLYTKASFGDGNLESIRISPLLKWYAGKKWDLYVVLGGDAALNDETTGDYFVGVGMSRRIYTGDLTNWAIPFTVDGFVDFTTADPNGEGSNINQINLGFAFSKPVKR